MPGYPYLVDTYSDPELGAIAVLYDTDGNVVATGYDPPMERGT